MNHDSVYSTQTRSLHHRSSTHSRSRRRYLRFLLQPASWLADIRHFEEAILNCLRASANLCAPSPGVNLNRVEVDTRALDFSSKENLLAFRFTCTDNKSFGEMARTLAFMCRFDLPQFTETAFGDGFDDRVSVLKAATETMIKLLGAPYKGDCAERCQGCSELIRDMATCKENMLDVELDIAMTWASLRNLLDKLKERDGSASTAPQMALLRSAVGANLSAAKAIIVSPPS